MIFLIYHSDIFFVKIKNRNPNKTKNNWNNIIDIFRDNNPQTISKIKHNISRKQ